MDVGGSVAFEYKCSSLLGVVIAVFHTVYHVGTIMCRNYLVILRKSGGGGEQMRIKIVDFVHAAVVVSALQI
jgi:hypothetical protein